MNSSLKTRQPYTKQTTENKNGAVVSVVYRNMKQH